MWPLEEGDGKMEGQNTLIPKAARSDSLLAEEGREEDLEGFDDEVIDELRVDHQPSQEI